VKSKSKTLCLFVVSLSASMTIGMCSHKCLRKFGEIWTFSGPAYLVIIINSTIAVQIVLAFGDFSRISQWSNSLCVWPHIESDAVLSLPLLCMIEIMHLFSRFDPIINYLVDGSDAERGVHFISFYCLGMAPILWQMVSRFSSYPFLIVE